MSDPELAARAQLAAERLERSWDRWRRLRGLATEQAQPVSSYVGYSLAEPWGRPRVVFGLGAEEAERLAALLEQDEGADPRYRQGLLWEPEPHAQRSNGAVGQASLARQPAPDGEASFARPAPAGEGSFAERSAPVAGTSLAESPAPSGEASFAGLPIPSGEASFAEASASVDGASFAGRPEPAVEFTGHEPGSAPTGGTVPTRAAEVTRPAPARSAEPSEGFGPPDLNLARDANPDQSGWTGSDRRRQHAES